MHEAPRIVVHCCLYAPDVVPDMPQVMSFSTADIRDCLQMALSLELLNTALYVHSCVLGQFFGKLISANVSQGFPYNIQQFPNVLQKYPLKQNIQF